MVEDIKETQVLEFGLGSERYCVDISYVSEIVDTADLTPIPNAPSHVEGVMDLRGRTTSIINPKRLFDIDDNDGDERRIVVFDPDKTEQSGATGWLVDMVDRVIRITGEDIDDPPFKSNEAVQGIVKQDGSFTIWVSPN